MIQLQTSPLCCLQQLMILNFPQFILVIMSSNPPHHVGQVAELVEQMRHNVGTTEIRKWSRIQLILITLSKPLFSSLTEGSAS